MTKQTLREILNAEIERLKQVSYIELLKLAQKIEVGQYGEGASFYQIEIQAFYDDHKTGILRVMVSVDDGGFSAFKPLTGDFIISPSGKLL